MEQITRNQPQSIDSEQAVLGAMLLSRDAIDKALEILTPGDFYRDAHGLVFECMTHLHHKNEPVDMLTVAEELKRLNNFEKVGGLPFITALGTSVPTAANVDHYARIVREKSELRSLIRAADEITSEAYDGSEDVEDIMDNAERRILEVSSRRSQSGITTIDTVVLDTLNRYEEIANSKGQLMGIPTGFIDLDKLISGLQKSDLIFVAARPSMGKTAFTLNIAVNVAIKQQLPVAFFSLEMSSTQLMMRIISSTGKIDSQAIRNGSFEEETWRKVMSAANEIYGAPLFIDDTPGITITQLRSKARRIKAQYGLELIVIDYLQLMQGQRKSANGNDRQQEVSEISRSLKALARELKVPIITLSQLNRSVESRQNKRPMLSDLRESGSLEQDADIVMFLYRDEYYNPGTSDKTLTEVIIAKHRNGPIDTIPLAFFKEYTRFENAATEQQEALQKQMTAQQQAQQNQTY